MKLLITGGAGFIGSNFILYWRKHHSADFLVNLDKLTYAGNLENLKSLANDRNYQFVKGNIEDAQLVSKLVREVDAVVHFAAETHVDRSIDDPAPFITTNVLGTYFLLEAAAKSRLKKFIHISTDEVFGQLPLSSSEKFSEETPYNPRSPYSASKAASDHLVRSYFTTYGVPTIIINCSNNFGPYQYPEKFIPLAITNLLEGTKVPIYGDGKNIRDWLYVEDHCRAIEVVLQKGKIGQTYLVGGKGEELSNLEVVKKILKLMGKNKNYIQFVKDRPGHDRKYAVNWQKINKELGWSPRGDFDYWLEKTISWYRDNVDWWKKLK